MCIICNCFSRFYDWIYVYHAAPLNNRFHCIEHEWNALDVSFFFVQNCICIGSAFEFHYRMRRLRDSFNIASVLKVSAYQLEMTVGPTTSFFLTVREQENKYIHFYIVSNFMFNSAVSVIISLILWCDWNICPMNQSTKHVSHIFNGINFVRKINY